MDVPGRTAVGGVVADKAAGGEGRAESAAVDEPTRLPRRSSDLAAQDTRGGYRMAVGDIAAHEAVGATRRPRISSPPWM